MAIGERPGYRLSPRLIPRLMRTVWPAYSRPHSARQDALKPGCKGDIVRKGSLTVPWLLLALVVLIFLSHFGPPPNPDKDYRFSSELAEIAKWLADFRTDVTADVPKVFASQMMNASVVVAFALIPAIVGLIYRRAFWWWFLVSFAILFLVAWSVFAAGLLFRSHDYALKLTYPYDSYLWIELGLIQLLIAFRLRRHSAVDVNAKAKLVSSIIAVLLILGAAGWLWYRKFAWLELGGALIVLQIAAAMLRQSVWSSSNVVNQGKNIVVCLDGTWNEPGTTEYGHVAETNVLKLFKLLKGELRQGKRHKQYNSNQYKEHLQGETIEAGAPSVRQIAFYYHGVGNKMENSEIGQVFGGAFGMGASAIVDRAYLDVAKVYRQGDRIFIFGFSRGAAIARLLASVIGHRSIPTSIWTLRIFGRSFALWSSSQKIDDVQNPVKVEVLGCWDTVGAFGIAKNIFGIPFQQMNLLKDLTVALCVKRAYHMVALDETRDAFVPTLMEPDPTDQKRITEVWFSGSHANVGGGYATDQLSDLTLDFLLRHVSSSYPDRPQDESWGLYLNAVAQTPGVNGDQVAMRPDPKGPIRHSTGAMYSNLPRRVPVHAVIHDSVFERMRNTFPVYAPQSLFDLNKELTRERKRVEDEVAQLRETSSVGEGEYAEILDWSRKKLTLVKWSDVELSNLPDPAVELSNPFPKEAAAPAGMAVATG